MSRQTRPTTVVSQPPTLSTESVCERFNRSQASWTASCASPTDPSIRYATACRWARWSSNCCVCQSGSSMRSHPRVGIRHTTDERGAADVTAARRLRPDRSKEHPMKRINAHDSTAGGRAIEVTGLRKIYRGGVEAVKGIDFDV